MHYVVIRIHDLRLLHVGGDQAEAAAIAATEGGVAGTGRELGEAHAQAAMEAGRRLTELRERLVVTGRR